MHDLGRGEGGTVRRPRLRGELGLERIGSPVSRDFDHEIGDAVLEQRTCVDQLQRRQCVGWDRLGRRLGGGDDLADCREALRGRQVVEVAGPRGNRDEGA